MGFFTLVVTGLGFGLGFIGRGSSVTESVLFFFVGLPD
jgi:hypothetical protein